ncbi:hypothetical protein PanWU01x14_251430 [Parasponia andersonii]|uniref:Uncharacterized protein n=1 Tax=Parasponia andersonii TaxID=3476 RepID=A0A2P5BCH5_PARAD|nr:hypothetical protein PanWU01x14_251430 [Parasponia andersonii]
MGLHSEPLSDCLQGEGTLMTVDVQRKDRRGANLVILEEKYAGSSINVVSSLCMEVGEAIPDKGKAVTEDNEAPLFLL